MLVVYPKQESLKLLWGFRGIDRVCFRNAKQSFCCVYYEKMTTKYSPPLLKYSTLCTYKPFPSLRNRRRKKYKASLKLFVDFNIGIINFLLNYLIIQYLFFHRNSHQLPSTPNNNTKKKLSNKCEEISISIDIKGTKTFKVHPNV